MKKILFFVGLFMICSAMVQSQEDTITVRRGAYLYLPIDVPLLGTPSLRQDLLSQGLPSPNNVSGAIGAGIVNIMGSYLWGVQAVWGIEEADVSSSKSSMNYYALSAYVGKDLSKSLKYSYYPFLGLKTTKLTYKYRQKSDEPSSISGYFSQDYNFKELSNERLNLDLGFGVMFHKRFMADLKVGYLIPLGKPNWKDALTDQEFSDSTNPDYNFYLTFSLGFGGTTMAKKVKNKLLLME